MADKKIVGIFAEQQEAIAAIEKLEADGYVEDEISILAKDREDAKKVKDETDIELETESPIEGAAGGAAAGGVVGGAGALLAGLGVITIPGIGPFLAAGPIAGTISGLVAGGAVGGIAGVLVDMGLTPEEAEEYSEYLERGDILVMVDKVDDEEKNKKAYENFYQNHGMITDSFKSKDKRKKRDRRKNKKYEPATPKRPGDRGDPRREEDFEREGPDGPKDRKDPYRPEDPNPFV